MTHILRYAAFTDHGRGGNPAGIVLDATGLHDDEMLAVAADVGFSETAFVLPGPDALGIRYFSPQAEVAFCGHATIATAVALAERDGPGTITLHTRAGLVEVRTASGPDGTTATLTSVPPRTRPADPATVERALAALGWDAEDLDPTYPVHVASAGVDHLVVAAREHETLATLDYDFDALGALMAEQGWTTVHAVWAESATLFHVRDPFPPGGVVEDPATGAAAAAFGGYLRALGLVTPPCRVTLLQGTEMGRPSRLLVDIDAGDGGIQVTGAAAPMEGG